MKNILPLIFLLCACTPTPSEIVTLPYDYASVDESVGCSEFPPSKSDISVSLLPGGVVGLTVNVHRKPGLFMDAIITNETKWQDDSVYRFSGEFRKPSEAQNEQIDVNLQFVEDFTEHRAEIIWTNNPHSELYGWVWTRFQEDTPAKLFYLGSDNGWHTFVLVTKYVSAPKQRVIHSIAVDGRVFEINREMGTLPKAWKSSFFAMLETHNMYTNCEPANMFVGQSEWKNIKIERLE